MTRLTQILDSVRNGDENAPESLLSVVYDELKRIAEFQFSKEKVGHTLQTTALINEAYLKLFGSITNPCWENRAHFFRAAAEAMRRILVDHAREKKSLKRGGNSKRSGDIHQLEGQHEAFDELMDVHQVLDELVAIHPTQAKVVKLRYFAGLTIEQIAELMDISMSTANRHWAFARAWLYERLGYDKNP